MGTLSEETLAPIPGRAYLPGSGGRGDLSEALLAADSWTDAMVEQAGIPVVDTSFVTIGGGMGSFVMCDYLRIAGVPTSEIRVLSALDRPWQTYEYLTRVSQIPRSERLRSDSASRPDNIWGFPSYALSEAIATRRLGSLWQVFVEPLFADYWTPKAGQVFESLEREAARIRYFDMLDNGLARVVRRRDGGGYFSILTPPEGAAATKRVAYRSRFVHVAVGYPGLRFLPDLQEYRTKYHDHQRVVNAYEPHEQVYETLLSRPCIVVVRGGGIVASRVLQRLMDDRLKHGAQTQIVHVFRTYVTGSNDGIGSERPHVFMRRKGGEGWAYQGFNYPKSVWGGQLKERMRKLEGEDRAALYKVIGGTNTPYRRLWQAQMAQGRSEGWYQTLTGKVLELVPGDNQVVTRISRPHGTLELPADFVIDCTGLEADIAEHRLLADLLEHAGAGRNPIGRLDVERSFELRGTASGDGAMYASGASTLGGYFPGVDTFLGLQIAAQEIADDLAKRGFGKRIGPIRSTVHWFKWLRGKVI
jgi:hypothetical protein